MAITTRVNKSEVLARAKAKYKEKILVQQAVETAEFLANTFRNCSKCGESKSLNSFSKSSTSRFGRDARCKICRAQYSHKRYFADVDTFRERGIIASEKYRAKNPIYRQRVYVLRRYGTTPEALMAFASAYLKRHGPVCACCNRECDAIGGVKIAGRRRLVVDHDHKTGKLRSMLCDFCNTALGKLGDNEHGVKQLLQYIRRHR